MFTTEVLDVPTTTNKKAHDIHRERFPFLRSSAKLSRFRLCKKSENAYQYDL